MLVFIPSLIVLYMAICDPAVWVALGLIPADTIAVDVEQFSVGLAIFVAIAATGVTTGLLASLNKDLAICSAITAIQQYSSRASRSMAILPGRAIRNISPDLSRDDYLAAYPRAESGFAFRLMLGLVVISVAFMLWDAHSATCATPQWLRVGSRFGFSRSVDWDAIERVATGCYLSGNGTVIKKNYKLYHSAGEVNDFGDAKLTRLAQLDELVRKANVAWEVARFDGGKFAGRAQWNLDAFEQVRENLSADDWSTFTRVFRLREWADTNRPRHEKRQQKNH
jgi:hypothetical protein